MLNLSFLEKNIEKEHVTVRRAIIPIDNEQAAIRRLLRTPLLATNTF